MTLSEVSTLCPAPEGWGDWYPDMDLSGTRVVGYVVEAKDGSAQVRVKDISSSGNTWNVSTFIRYKSSCSWVVETDIDLPGAYLRALTAVGFAPDAEKEALRAEVESLRDALKVTEGVVGSAYRQVQALCADVADLRRRLTWTEEVPREAGRYLVEMPMRRSCLWTRSEYQPGKHWCSSTSGWCGDDVFPPGSRFLPLANLKETR